MLIKNKLTSRRVLICNNLTDQVFYMAILKILSVIK